MDKEIIENVRKTINSEISKQDLMKSEGAALIGLSTSHFSKKLKGTYPFTEEELLKLADWVKIEINFDKDRIDYWWNNSSRLDHVWDENNLAICGAYFMYAPEKTKFPILLLYIYRHVWGGVGRLFYEARSTGKYKEHGIVECNMLAKKFILAGEDTTKRVTVQRKFNFSSETKGIFQGHTTWDSEDGVEVYGTILKANLKENKLLPVVERTRFPIYLLDSFIQDSRMGESEESALKESCSKIRLTKS